LWSLINASQLKSGGSLGITRGTGTVTGVDRDRTSYKARDVIGTLAKQLGEVDNGFDWEIDALRQLNVYYPTRGVARKFGLDYGGSVARVQRSFRPENYANVVTIVGGGATTPTQAVEASIASDLAGRWESSYSYPSVVEQPTVDGKATLGLATMSKPSYGYKLTLRQGVWTGVGQLWLGDTAPLSIVSSPGLVLHTTCRIVQVDITPDGDGGEEVDLVVEDVA
jgi:hypothetical protein